MNKGQSLSFDFLTASSIFLLLVSFIMIYWTYTNTQITETGNIEAMVDRAQTISEVLFTEGYPKYWSPADVINLGFQNDNRFNQTKLNYFNSIGYIEVKRLIGVGDDEFHIRIYDQGDQTKFSFGDYPANEDNLVQLKRIGILDGEIVFAEIFVWD